MEKKKNKVEEDELETDLNNLKENQIEGGINNDDNVVKNKIKPSDFFKMTMNLLQ